MSALQGPSVRAILDSDLICSDFEGVKVATSTARGLPEECGRWLVHLSRVLDTHFTRLSVHDDLGDLPGSSKLVPYELRDILRGGVKNDVIQIFVVKLVLYLLDQRVQFYFSDDVTVHDRPLKPYLDLVGVPMKFRPVRKPMRCIDGKAFENLHTATFQCLFYEPDAMEC